ncbi:hypothetical protein ABIA33_001940 [Streptacidiphilus sp. MAP12-16]|uniref:AAA family ATPase n=1 Tax=Streptacidiphilus sp. MAP12-16 TaxID=3156300 RepID=UPI0035189856
MSEGHYPGSLPAPTPGPPRATLQLRAVPASAAQAPHTTHDTDATHVTQGGQGGQAGGYGELPHPHPRHSQHPQTPVATGHFLLPTPPTAPLPPGVGHPHAVPLGPVAVLLIGPAGAGKTSVARHWADHRRTPTAHISLDDVREWVRSGFANPQSGWNDQSEAQYRLARRTCGFAARNYLANGISCIIDDAVFPDRPAIGLGGWKRHVGPELLPVVLLPGLDVVLARNAQRSGVRRLEDEEVARIHGRMAGWYGSGLPIIDNSKLDVPGTAAALDQVLAQILVNHSLARPRSW